MADAWLDRLRQTTSWTNVNGEVIPVLSIEPDYAKNILRFLHRRAGLLKGMEEWWYATTPGPSGDMANDLFDAEFDRLLDENPHDWLRRQPLYVAIRERAHA